MGDELTAFTCALCGGEDIEVPVEAVRMWDVSQTLADRYPKATISQCQQCEVVFARNARRRVLGAATRNWGHIENLDRILK